MNRAVSLSMDGPNVNWSLFESLNDHLRDEHGFTLLNVGSCGLHTLHNALRGF